MKKRTCLPVIAFCALGACALGTGSTTGDAMAEQHVFCTTIAGDEGGLSLLVMPDAAQVVTNWSEPPRSAIGLFRMPIGAGVHADLVAEVSGLRDDSQAPPPPMPPGSRMVNVGLTEDGKPLVVHTGEFRKLPGYLAPTVAKLDALIAKVLDHPRKAVAAGAAWAGASVAAGADIVLDFTLRNAGEEPVLIANPAAGADETAVGVMLTLIWKGGRKDAGNVNPLQVAPGEIVQLDGKGRAMSAAGTALSLQAGDEARFQLRRTLRLVPGEYRTRLAISCRDLQEDTVPRINGTIVAVPGDLTIVR